MHTLGSPNLIFTGVFHFMSVTELRAAVSKHTEAAILTSDSKHDDLKE